MLFLCGLITAVGLFVLITALASRLTRRTKLLRGLAPLFIRNINASDMEDEEFLRRYSLPLLYVGLGLTAVGILFICWSVSGFRVFRF